VGGAHRDGILAICHLLGAHQDRPVVRQVHRDLFQGAVVRTDWEDHPVLVRAEQDALSCWTDQAAQHGRVDRRVRRPVHGLDVCHYRDIFQVVPDAVSSRVTPNPAS